MRVRMITCRWSWVGGMYHWVTVHLWELVSSVCTNRESSYSSHPLKIGSKGTTCPVPIFDYHSSPSVHFPFPNQSLSITLTPPPCWGKRYPLQKYIRKWKYVRVEVLVSKKNTMQSEVCPCRPCHVWTSCAFKHREMRKDDKADWNAAHVENQRCLIGFGG